MKKFNSKYIMTPLMLGMLTVAGCTSTPVIIDGEVVEAAVAEFPALFSSDGGETVTRGRENVIIAPILNEDGNIEALQLIVFGETVTFSRDDILEDDRITAVFENGSTIAISGPFGNAFAIAEALNGELDDLDRRRAFAREHFSGFIVRIDGNAIPPQNVEMGEPQQMAVLQGVINVQQNPFEDITDVVAVTAGNDTEVENLGAFVEPSEGGAPLTATYRGPATLVDAGEGVINGNARIDVDFTNQKAGGYISDLFRGEDSLITLEGSQQCCSVGIRGYYSKGPTEQIRINETDIVDSGFVTDLDLVRSENGPALGNDNGNLLDGNLQDAPAVEGFFSDSQVNASFFGDEGEELGGTIEYTRTQDFQSLDGGQGPEAATAEAIEPVEGIGVFSTRSEEAFQNEQVGTLQGEIGTLQAE